ncbi:helix-turn-helix domain-containing protein [Gemmiger formicilis]|jgi:hypothetical protein|uniref:helix-turn-helix domain-containing protein n=1 Tax=Gemmiger formicilis TaxID=745368 RepID=UPI003CCB55D3
MGKYRGLLIRAKGNDTEAVTELYQQYQAMIKKYSYVDGKNDEDLHQILVIVFLSSLAKFKF